jgi:hypothetical protein
MPQSPTSRTLTECRRLGWLQIDVVERWIPETKQRRDLFGFIDLVGIRQSDAGLTLVGIQTTTMENLAHRVTKITVDCREAAMHWLEAGGELEAWGWYRYAKQQNGRWWRPTIRAITLTELRG